MMDVEGRIEWLHLEGSEGDYHLNFEKSPDGWIRIEQTTDDEGYALPEFTRTTVPSLSREVADHAAAYLTTTEVLVRGVSPAELLTWIRPLLHPGQDSVRINEVDFDLYPEG